jgi:hypothetical protein
MSSSSVEKATATTKVAAGGGKEDPKFDPSPYLQQLGVGDIFLRRWGVSLAVAGIMVVLHFHLFSAWRKVLKGIGLDKYAILSVYAYAEYEVIYHEVANEVAAAATSNGGDGACRWLEDAIDVDGGDTTASLVLGTLFPVFVVSFSSLVLHRAVMAISDGVVIRIASDLYISPDIELHIPGTPIIALVQSVARIVPLVGTQLFLGFALAVPAFGLFALAMVLALVYHCYWLAIMFGVLLLCMACFVAIGRYKTITPAGALCLTR